MARFKMPQEPNFDTLKFTYIGDEVTLHGLKVTCYQNTLDCEMFNTRKIWDMVGLDTPKKRRTFFKRATGKDCVNAEYFNHRYPSQALVPYYEVDDIDSANKLLVAFRKLKPVMKLQEDFEGYKAEITPEGIIVGCTFISEAIVRQVMKDIQTFKRRTNAKTNKTHGRRNKRK